MVNDIILEARGVSKDFGPVRVLFGVDLEFRRGEVHALIGENGAGKSTLVKILSGYHTPSEGVVRIDGNPVRLSDSRIGEDMGVVLIHQEFNLARHLTVEENIFLGRELHRGPFLDKAAMRRQARAVLAELGMDIDPDSRLLSLSISEVQMVEIGKALERNVAGTSRVLIMDEPTGVLTPTEAEVLFALIGRLKSRGITVIYISHKLDEVKRVADRITVLRDGRLITTQEAGALSEEAMANLMVGRKMEDLYPEKRPPADTVPVVLRVQDLTIPKWADRVTFDVREGEILGFAGLIGSGRTELMEGLMGLRKPVAGQIQLFGEDIRASVQKPWDMVDRGVVYLSEDRKGKGIITSMALRPNVTLMALRKYCHPFIDRQAEQETLLRAVAQFDVRAKQLNATVDTLSGGNQQKLALAKIMDINPRLVILDEPTRGIDVGTKSQIYAFIAELASRGIPCIFISSELPEVIGLCHRVVVMRSGRVTGIVAGEEINEQEIMKYAAGIKGKDL